MRRRRDASLSPCPRWSNVTTRWSRAKTSTWSAKSSLAPPNPCTRSSPGASTGPATTVERPTPSSVVTRTGPIYGRTRTAGERTRNMRGWRLPTRLARRAGRRHLRLSGAAKLGLRIVVSAALLAVLITKIPADDIQPKDTHFGTLAFLAAGLAVHASSGSCSRRGAGSVSSRCSTSTSRSARCSAHYLAGQFVGNVLPSTIGGDVLRVSRAAKTTGAGDVAFASVVIERLSGFVALPLLTFIGFALEPSLLESRPRLGRARSSPAPPSPPSVVILVVAGSPHLAGRFAKRAELDALHRGGARRRRPHPPRAPPGAAACSCAAIVYQASVLVAVVLRHPRARRRRYRTARCSRSCPRSRRRRCCPISLSGLGIREGLLVLLLHPLGVPTGQGDRRRAALVRHDAGRQPPRRAGVRGRAAPRPRAGRRRRRRRHAHGRVGDGPTRIMSVVEEDASAPDEPSRRRSSCRCTGGSPAVGPCATVTASTGGASSLAVAHLLRRLLVRPEPAPRQRSPGATSTPRTSSRCRRRSASTTSRRSRRGRSARAPFIIACNYFYGSLHFIVTGGVMIYLYRRWTDDYPRWRNTLGIATGLALIGFAFFPLLPPRSSTATAGAPPRHPLRVRRHPGEGPRVLVVQLRRGEQDLEPVRGHAQRALRLGAVVRVRARAAAEARLGEGRSPRSTR